MLARIARAAMLSLALVILAHPLAAQSCVLEYRRADNMWSAIGRPDGFLGVETITLAPGTSRVFVTDWKYEKTRNDGTNYYGSHLRLATNKGPIPAIVEVQSAALAVESMVSGLLGVMKISWNKARVKAALGTERAYRADLAAVHCPAA